MYYGRIVAVVMLFTMINVFCEDKKDRLDRSMEYFEEGKLLMSEEKFELALPFYRAALRLSPDYPLFLEKTAALELKLNDITSARKRFRRISSLGWEVTIPESMSLISSDPICSSDPDFRQIGVPEISADKFLQCGSSCYDISNFVSIATAPFIVRDGAKHMRWNISYFESDSLIANFDQHVVDFYPQNLLQPPVKNYQKNIAEVFEYIRFPDGAYMSVDASNPGAYGQWNINNSVWTSIIKQSGITIPRPLERGLKDLLGISKAQELNSVDEKGNHPASSDLKDDGVNISALVDHFHKQTHWNMILIAEAGAGMFNHQDVLPVGSWQVQVQGTKQWHLCPPLPPSTDDRRDGIIITANTSDEKDRYKECPGSFPVICFEAEVRSGDLIYYPPHFWHRTENTASPSVAISSTVILKEFENEFLEFVSGQCNLQDQSLSKFKFSDQLCDHVAKQIASHAKKVI